MQLELFTEWFKHFLLHVKPTVDDPALLILDGHMSHTRNLSFIDMARENNVIVICLPPHCTHRLQPLDVAFMGPLNTYFVQAIEIFLLNNPGRAVSQFCIGKIFGEAYLKAAKPTTAINGFRTTGIYPFNSEIFGEDVFAAAITTDIALSNTQNQTPIPNEIIIDPLVEPLPEPEMPMEALLDQPGPSNFLIGPNELAPPPRVQESITGRRQTNRKKGKASLITGSPYRKELKESLDSKKSNATKKSSFQRPPKTPKTKKQQTKKKKVVNMERESDDDDAECFYCHQKFTQSSADQGWIKCNGCVEWAHESCAGCDDDEDDFICTKCLK